MKLAYSEILIAGNNDDERVGWFDWLYETFEPHFNRAIEAVIAFYDEYQMVGMVIAILVLFFGIVALVFFFRFIGFLLRKLRRFILWATGIEKKRREKREKARSDVKERRASYNELKKWSQNSKSSGRESNWDEKVNAAADEIRDAKAKIKEEKEQLWLKYISGELPYDEMLEQMEKGLFAFEEKIHEVISRITTIPKGDLVLETAKLRVGIEALRSDTDNLKKLQEAFPDDMNLSALAELADAFIQSTKNIEKGFFAALSG